MAPEPDGKRELRQRIRQKNEKLKTARQRIAEKDREIESLRQEVARTRVSSGPATSREFGVPIFFLVGRAKSGTSWLMRTLNAHPEILCRGEGRIFGRDYKSEEIKNMQSRTIQPSSLYRAILDAEYLNAWVERSVWTRDGDKEEHLAGLTGVAAEYFLTKKLAGTGKSIVGDKTPFLGDHMVREIGEMCPGARVIHIVRDGRDVAVSSMHHTWNHVKQEGGTYDLAGRGAVEYHRAQVGEPHGAVPEGQHGALAFPVGVVVVEELPEEHAHHRLVPDRPPVELPQHRGEPGRAGAAGAEDPHHAVVRVGIAGLPRVPQPAPGGRELLAQAGVLLVGREQALKPFQHEPHCAPVTVGVGAFGRYHNAGRPTGEGNVRGRVRALRRQGDEQRRDGRAEEARVGDPGATRRISWTERVPEASPVEREGHLAALPRSRAW